MMPLHPVGSWLRQLFGQQRQRPIRRFVSYRPSLLAEALEARLVPAAPVGVVVEQPAAAPLAGGENVIINGQNFTSAAPTNTSVQFINVTTNASTTVTPPPANVAASTLTVVQPTLAQGIYNVTITTDQGTSAVSPTAQLLVGAIVTGISPTSGPESTAVPITITGANLTGATEVDFGTTAVTTGIAVNAAGTVLTVTAPALPEGTYTIIVKTPAASGGTSLAIPAATYTVGATVSGVSPNAGATASSQIVTITGFDLDGATQVNFGSTVVSGAAIISNTSSTLTVTAPAGLPVGTYPVTVTTAAHGSSSPTPAAQYIVQAAPVGIVVTLPLPAPVSGVVTVTLAGQNMGTIVTPPVITLTNVAGGSPVTATAVVVTQTDANGNGNALTFALPTLTPGIYDILVTNAAGTSTASTSDQITVGTVVSAVSPASGPHAGGTPLTITGVNLTGATQVNFGATPVTTGIVVNGAGTSLTVTSPPLPVGTYNVSVVAPTGTSAVTSATTFHSGATVTAISPTSGAPGTAVLITITGSDLTGATEVDFGTTVVTTGITVNPAGTSLTVTAPNSLIQGIYPITVKTTSNGNSVAVGNVQFVVQTAPSGIVVVSPAGGLVAGGETVTVTGQNLGAIGAPPTVNFVNANGVATPGTNVIVTGVDANGNGNQLTVTQPPLAVGNYDVTVTNGAGTSALSSNDQFAVGPVVQYLSPRGGPKEGGTTITISGSNLAGATSALIGTTAATIVPGSNTSTSLQVTTLAMNPGTYDVTVTTAGGTSVVSAATKFQVGVTVTAISPTSILSSAPTTITITGFDFANVTEVLFGSTVVTSGITVNQAGTSLTVTAPAGLPTGIVDVVVKSSTNGTSVKSTATQLLVDPFTIAISNQSGLTGVPMYVGIWGQLAFDKTTGQLDQHPTNTSLANDNLVEVYFNSQGQYAFTAPLYIGHPGPNFASVPTFQVSFDSSNNAIINLPNIFNSSARLVMGLNGSPVASIVDATGAISAPTSTADLIYDFIEFTLDQTGKLYSNTSQIDQVGIPFTVKVDSADPNVKDGVGILVPRDDIFGTGPNSFTSYLTAMGGNASLFAVSATIEGTQTLNNVAYPTRLLSPADVLTIQPSNPLSTYFDSALTTLFSTARTDLNLLVPNPNYNVTTGNNANPNDSTTQNYLFTGAVVNNTLQFTAIINGVSQTLTIFAPTSGGSAMVFACNGVFADNVAQYGPDTPLVNRNGLLSNLLANIENQVVSALNRGIANTPIPNTYANATDAWIGTQAGHNQDHLPYYQPGTASNFYAGYLHANLNGKNVSRHQLAYGYAYDDQGNQSSTQVSSSPKSMSITLTPWQANSLAPLPISNGDYINELYSRLLGRSADPAGYNSWVSLLTAGTVSRSEVALRFQQSEEYRSNTIDELYVSLLHREADAAGKANFMAFTAAGAGMDQVRQVIYSSPEYFLTRGGQTNNGFLDALYHDEFGRAVDPSGRATWDAAFAQGASRSTVAFAVMHSLEANQDLVRGYYADELFRAPRAAELAEWVARLQSGTRPDDILAGILASTEFFNDQ